MSSNPSTSASSSTVPKTVVADKKKTVRKGNPASKLSVVIPTLLILAAFVFAPDYVKTAVTSAPADSKPYGSFDEFYPFYISQHQDDTCRRLHFVGTTFALLIALWEPFVVPSLTLGGMAAYVAFFATRHIGHGLFEMATAFGVFLYFMRKLTGTWHKGILTLAIPYGFAWVGHFFFEHNKPATFVYPIFSLLGDFKLWYEIATKIRAF